MNGNNPNYYQNKSSYMNSNIQYSQMNSPQNPYGNVPMPSYGYPLYYNPTINYSISVPMNLAKSLEGKYFVGYVDGLTFGAGTFSWARLYNPPDSGVNLHVTVWTVSDVAQTSFTATIYFNSTLMGTPLDSENITTTNTSIIPLPEPKIKLQYAATTRGFPQEGIKAFIRRGQPNATIVSEEEGKFIFPPGGNFLIFLSNPQNPTIPVSASIAFGWWEEPIL
jgi:hypothetical protein